MRDKYYITLQKIENTTIKEVKKKISKKSFDRLIRDFNLRNSFKIDKRLMFRVYNLREKEKLQFNEICKSLDISNRSARRMFNLACYYKNGGRLK